MHKQLPINKSKIQLNYMLFRRKQNNKQTESLTDNKIQKLHL